MTHLVRPPTSLLALTLCALLGGCGGCPASPAGDDDDDGASSGGNTVPRDGGSQVPDGGAAGTSSGTTSSGGGASSVGAGSSSAAGSGAGTSSSSVGSSSAPASSGAGSSSLGSSSSSSGAPCMFSAPLAADADRVILVSHPFSDTPGQQNHEIRSLTLGAMGLPRDDGMRLDMGWRVTRLVFLPSGALALVLGEDGQLATVAVNGAADLRVVDEVALPLSGYEFMVTTPDGRTAYVVASDSGPNGGIRTVTVGCDGQLTDNPEAFVPLRLTETVSLLPDGQHMLVLGGQVTGFEPMDPMDTRLFALSPTLRQLKGFDLWSDYLTTGRMGVSPAGDLVVVPNNSLFSQENAQLRVFTLSAPSTTMVRTQLIMDLDTPAEAAFSPDGQTVLVTRPEVNRLTFYRRNGDSLDPAGEIGGLGLVDQMAWVLRGPRAGTLLMASTDTNGASNVAVVQVTGPGMVTDLGQVDLGPDFINIPDAIAVAP